MTTIPKAVGFDLDYTLYDTDGFLQSFFAAIAPEVGRRLGQDPARVAAVFGAALERLTLHHPRLLGAALEDLGCRDAALEQDLVERYRRHRPALAPYPGAREVLTTLRSQGCRLFLVTDGHSATQQYKVEALGLGPLLEAQVFTGVLPATQHKPSPVPFLMATGQLGLRQDQCVYVGDDPPRDFEGPRRLGIRTVGVATGPFAGLPAAARQRPDVRIGAIGALRGVL